MKNYLVRFESKVRYEKVPYLAWGPKSGYLT